MRFSRRTLLEGAVDGVLGLWLNRVVRSPAGDVVEKYLFGDDAEEGFIPIYDEADLERIDAARMEIPPELRTRATPEEAYNFGDAGTRYVLGSVDNPLGLAHVDVFESPEHFLDEGYLAQKISGYRSFQDRIFNGWKGGDVVEVVPFSLYNQGLDGVAGDLETVDLSRPSTKVLGAMVKQGKGLGGEYTFVNVPIRDAMRVHSANPSSAGVMDVDSMLLVYDQNHDGASYDAVSF